MAISSMLASRTPSMAAFSYPSMRRLARVCSLPVCTVTGSL
ncbi:MAG: hypothetical protein NWE88_06500 [Candidatus Bathyarchaeota archaeon]|nr:hypothetical protein [Candidatus Bathyarchaeota archaeon]